MPIYEYKCAQCGALFERLARIDEAAIQECPECGGSGRKLLSVPAGITIKDNLSLSSGRRDNCAQSSPCCGRAERCQTPPCESR